MELYLTRSTVSDLKENRCKSVLNNTKYKEMETNQGQPLRNMLTGVWLSPFTLFWRDVPAVYSVRVQKGM